MIPTVVVIVLGLVLLVLSTRSVLQRKRRSWQQVECPDWIARKFPRRITKHNQYYFRGKHWHYRVYPRHGQGLFKIPGQRGIQGEDPSMEGVDFVEARLRRRFW